MNEKSEGKLKQESLALAAIGRLDIPLFGQALANHNGELIAGFWKLLDEAKADFPYKIYKDNDGFGEDEKPTFSFYEKNPIDPDKSFPVEDLLEVECEIVLWLQKWFGNLKSTNS